MTISDQYKRSWRKLGKLRKKRPPRLHGAAPGTLITPPDSKLPSISIMAYGPDEFVEAKIDTPDQLSNYIGKWPVLWVNVEGLGDAQTIGKIGDIFGLHRLALEDVLNAHQRAKVEQFGTHYFIVIHEVTMHEVLETEQISLFLGAHFVITFQERAGDCWEPIRERIRTCRGRVRSTSSDYLIYALIDTVVDNYFPFIESFDTRLEQIEDVIITQPKNVAIPIIHDVKRDLLMLRRAVWPLREAINVLLRDSSAIVHEETRLYFRDCYDHIVRIIELNEVYRELAANLMELYLSVVSTRMNEIMKVLTIISTIFIPLGFIAGVYGMNFDRTASPFNMPELGWYWGYPFALLLMIVTAIAFLIFFYIKGWFGASPYKELLKQQLHTNSTTLVNGQKNGT